MMHIGERVSTTYAHIWKRSVLAGVPTAFWRLPRSQQKELVVSTSGLLSMNQLDIQAIGSGFLVRPFSGNATFFMPADKHYTFDKTGLIIGENGESENPPNTDCQSPCQTENFEKKITQPTQKEDFIQATKQAIQAIEAGVLRKVVLSRTKKIRLHASFDLLQTFDTLCDLYPNAFISMVYLPSVEQIWLGASPEVLVSEDENGVFRTMALAGTQSAINSDGETIKPAYASWTQKEIEEQALVSRYIIDCFKKIRLREFEEEGPKTMVAGNLLHLQTDFWVDTLKTNFQELTSVMLELLHPTSAVCGMPKNEALDFILAHEKHDRELYSGFWGPVNVERQTQLFVNLRTMKIENGTATLFAGCGITADSIPEKEWLETEMKCQTLEAALISN